MDKRHGAVDGAAARGSLSEVLALTAGTPGLKLWVGAPEGAAAIWPDAVAIPPSEDLPEFDFDPELATVADLAQWLMLPPFGSAVELNGEVVRKAEYPASPLKDRDTLEVIRLVGGG